MTSTNINIGIEGRASSRILKPPGGAHTDIFGPPQAYDCVNAKYSKQFQKSSISKCFETETAMTKETVTENGDLSNGNENELKNTIDKEEDSKPVAKSTRVRVPPGGFSSSFW